MSRRFWKKHGDKIFFGGMIATSVIFSLGDLNQRLSALGSLKQQSLENNVAALRIKQSHEQQQTLREVANQRMKDGCTLVVDVGTAKNLVTLQEGQPVRDRTNNSFLPEGITVCGANGETAVLKKNYQGVPVIQDIAVGDRQLIYPNLKKVKGASVYYNVPKGGGE